MHSACGPARDSPRLRRVADVENLEPAPEIRIDPSNREHFAVDQHQSVFNPYFVRQRAFRNADAREIARFRRIGDIDYAGAVGRLHVAHIGDVVAYHHLPAAGQVMKSDDLDAICGCHRDPAPDTRSYGKECSTTVRSTSTSSRTWRKKKRLASVVNSSEAADRDVRSAATHPQRPANLPDRLNGRREPEWSYA